MRLFLTAVLWKSYINRSVYSPWGWTAPSLSRVCVIYTVLPGASVCLSLCPQSCLWALNHSSGGFGGWNFSHSTLPNSHTQKFCLHLSKHVGSLSGCSGSGDASWDAVCQGTPLQSQQCRQRGCIRTSLALLLWAVWRLAHMLLALMASQSLLDGNSALLAVLLRHRLASE